MNAIAFDTLKVARRLTDAGLDQKTAEGLSETFAEVFAEREDSLATKADLRELKAELKADISALRADLGVVQSDLRAEFRSSQNEPLRWMVGSQVALAAVIIAAMKLL